MYCFSFSFVKVLMGGGWASEPVIPKSCSRLSPAQLKALGNICSPVRDFFIVCSLGVLFKEVASDLEQKGVAYGGEVVP